MKRAFVLSGGGCLGALQVGALRSLLEHEIRPDMLVGCSVGAINALNQAIDVGLPQLDRVIDLWRQVTQQKVYPGGRFSIFWRVVTGQDSLHDNRRYYQFLQESGCTPALTFGALRGAPLYVTATHLRSGRLHVFGDDPNDCCLDALMASTALTPMHPPWEINGERFVDGGTVTPLPLRVALERGATEIYALHIHQPGENPAPKPVRGVPGHITRAVDTMLQLQAEHDLHLVSDQRRVRFHHMELYATFAIEPTDFSRSDELMAIGYQQAEAYLDAGQARPLTAAHPQKSVRWPAWLGRWQPVGER